MSQSLLPFIQVTLLLIACLCVWRLLFRQRAAIRHALLAVQLMVAPVLVVAALMDAKPNFTFHIIDPVPEKSLPDRDAEATSQPNDTFDFASGVGGLCRVEPDGDVLACAVARDSEETDPALAPPPVVEIVTNSSDDSFITNPDSLLTSTDREAEQPSDTDWWAGCFLVVWSIGFGVISVRVVFGVYRLRRKVAVARAIEPSELTTAAQALLNGGRKMEVRESRELTMPLTAGVLRPVILLPSDFRAWSEVRLQSVLSHEVAHANRFDPAVSLASYFCCAALWFHPLMWIASSFRRRECEKAADDVALKNGIRPTDYAEQLVSLVRQYGQQIAPLPGAVSMASHSDLHGRVDAVLNRTPATDRSRLCGIILVASAVVLPILAGSVRVDRMVAAEPPTAESETAVVADTNTVTARQEALRRREAETLAATIELRQLIDDELATAWESNSGKNHTMTVLFLTNALANLGQFDAITKLRDDVRATGDKALAKVVRSDSNGVFTARMVRQDYAAADQAKPRSSSSMTHYGTISWAIRNRDLDVAEKMMVDLEKIKIPKDGKVRYRGALTLANAEFAIAAHWLGETDRIVPALRRYRALVENKDVSTRPIDEDADWIKTDYMFGPYFVLTLASCGHGALAVSIADSLGLGKPPKAGGFYPYSMLNLCSRLAQAGDTERSLRIARQEFNDGVPAELLRVLCRRALRDGKLDAARRFAAEFHSAVLQFSFEYRPPHKRHEKLVTEQSKLLDRINIAADHMGSFVRDMKAEQQPELARAAAAAYVKLSDRFVDEYENKSSAADILGWRRFDRLVFRSELDPLVELLPPDELKRFLARQHSFVEKHAAVLQPGRSRNKARVKFDMLLASLGTVPNSLSRFEMRERLSLVERLLAAGNHAGAKSVFETTREQVTRANRANGVSGSAGGRVVHVGTQHRYIAAQMAIKCGELAAGVTIVELIKHRGERVDGYRVLGRVYTEATDMATAFEWSKSLNDSDLRLAALVGILEAKSASVAVTEPDELAEFLSEVKSVGELLILWGC